MRQEGIKSYKPSFASLKKARKWTKMTEGVNIALVGDMIKGIVETKQNKWGSEDTKCDNQYGRNRKIEALIDKKEKIKANGLKVIIL